MFCYSNNGLSMRAVEADYVAQSGEILFANYATPFQLSQAFPNYALIVSQETIKQQIAALEATVTPRRMREAALGIDGGWLANVNNQIIVLRAQL